MEQRLVHVSHRIVHALPFPRLLFVLFLLFRFFFLFLFFIFTLAFFFVFRLLFLFCNSRLLFLFQFQALLFLAFYQELCRLFLLKSLFFSHLLPFRSLCYKLYLLEALLYSKNYAIHPYVDSFLLRRLQRHASARLVSQSAPCGARLVHTQGASPHPCSTHPPRPPSTPALSATLVLSRAV